MKVRDLIDELECLDPGAEVMVAHQPSWPLAETLAAVRCLDVEGDVECPDHEGFSIDHDPECLAAADDEDLDVVWLVAGGHAWDRSPYAPREVFGS